MKKNVTERFFGLAGENFLPTAETRMFPLENITDMGIPRV